MSAVIGAGWLARRRTLPLGYACRRRAASATRHSPPDGRRRGSDVIGMGEGGRGSKGLRCTMLILSECFV